MTHGLSSRLAAVAAGSLVLFLAAAACQLTVSPDSYQSGICPAGQKACSNRCVPKDDVATGCGDESCSKCNVFGAAAICKAERCTIGLCLPGYADCDGKDTNGCEVDLNNEVHNCGACGLTCTAKNDRALPLCQRGICATTCKTGFADCAPSTTNPVGTCPIDTTLDPANCGGCGHSCGDGGACLNGTCQDGGA